MKNKIVKALVLASIVSMTATGAAGLTFADDDVVTGDTTSTSTEATTTTKTVDQLAEALTEAQEDAATKEAAFTKANEDFDAAKAAVEVVDGYEKDVKKQENALIRNNARLDADEQATYKLIGVVTNAADTAYTANPSDVKAKAAKEKLASLSTKYLAYSEARRKYEDELRKFNPVHKPEAEIAAAKKELDTLKSKYEDALKAYKEDMKTATADDFVKAYDIDVPDNTDTPEDETKYFAIDALLKAVEDEEEDRTEYETTLNEIEKLKDERSKIDLEEENYRAAALGKARKALVKATKDYNEALANVKTAKENYTTATKDLVPVFRVFHPGTMEHLYTTGAHERDVLVEKGWKDEKVAWLTVGKDAEDAAPVYRLCYPGTGDHHYTTDKNERDTLIKTQGWIDETVAFYVPKKGDASVYRVYLSSLKIGAHHFTTGRNEYDTLVQNGWRPEGVSFEVSAKDWIDVSDIKTEDERIAKAEELTKD